MAILVGSERGYAVPSHPSRGLAATRREPDCSGTLSRIDLVDDIPVARWHVMCGQPKQGFERNMAIETTIVAKDEFIEIGVNMLAPQPMIRSKAPSLQQ